jgi:hypothetical protein
MTHRHHAITDWLAHLFTAAGLEVYTEERAFAIVELVHREMVRARAAKKGGGGTSPLAPPDDDGDAIGDNGVLEDEDDLVPPPGTPSLTESRMRMDTVVRATMADVRELARRHPLIHNMFAHALDKAGGSTRSTDPVLLLFDHSVAHPGPHMGTLATSAINAAKGEPPKDEVTDDPVGDKVFRLKCNTYGEATRRLSGNINAGDTMVFLPLPINAFGRLHPVTWHALNYFIQQAASNTGARSYLTRDEKWATGWGPDDLESLGAQRLTTYQRNKWRSLAIVLQQSLAEKVCTTMLRQTCPKRGQGQGQAVAGAAGAAGVAGMVGTSPTRTVGRRRHNRRTQWVHPWSLRLTQPVMGIAISPPVESLSGGSGPGS